MLLCCLRLPAPADGSPDVKAFAREATAFLRASDPVYVMNTLCARDRLSPTAGELFVTGTQIRTSLVFYLDRPLTCIEERQALNGAIPPGAYLVTDGESWPRVSQLASMVLHTVDGHGYVLGRMK